MAVLFIVGVLAIAITVVVIALGTTTARALENPSSPPGTPPREGTGFPSDYPTARQAFLDAVADTGGRLESIENPNAKAPDGEPIYMDVAWFGDEAAERTLVVCSGTHGVEGFAGSGIQTRLLREEIVSDLPPTVNLLMIHAINPYGMAHWRRVNEDNVDVNRNFRDFSVPASTNVAYAELSEIIAPASMSFWAEATAWGRLIAYRATRGNFELQRAISQGQYASPKGLFYGGSSEAWSNTALRSVIGRYLAAAHRVIVIDIHTGLGEYGKWEILLHEGASEYQRALQIWGSDVVENSVTGDSVSVRIDASVKQAFTEMQNESAETTAVTLEFGTLPPMEVFIALRAENWQHHNGPDGPRAKAIKASLLKAFHPGLREWEDAVWGQSKSVLDRALEHLAQ